MIMNGNSPTLISGVPNRAPSRATIKSHASAIPSAPASTWPLAAQIVGLPSSPISRNSRGNRSVAKCLWMSGASAANPPRLAPALNTRSWVEVRTTHRTPSSSRAASSACVSSVSSSSESAFRVSGWLRLIVATPSAVSYSSVS